MKRITLRNTFSVAVSIVATIVATTALAQPSQGGNGSGMMGGNGLGAMGGYGGYGGLWLPIVLVIVVAGLVAWIVKNNGK